MTFNEFSEQLNRLSRAFDPKLFPAERVAMLFETFKGGEAQAFKAAIDHVILTMPMPTQIFTILENHLRQDKAAGKVYLGSERMDREHPVQGNAKQMMERYLPNIKGLLKGTFPAPPYDMAARIDSEGNKS